MAALESGSARLAPFKYSDRVQLKVLLDGGAELAGQRVVVGGWVKSSKEVEKSAPPPPLTDETKTEDVSCVEIIQSRIPLIRNILEVFGGSGYAARKKRDPVPPKPMLPKPSIAYLLLTDGSCVATLQVHAFHHYSI